MVEDYQRGPRSLSPPERTAARAARTRTFEAILHDQNRFSYFLDYLSVHAQAHKLLFWFEIEQFKLLAGDDREMASHQETIFEKYFGAGARGGAMGLELPPYAAEHTEMLYSRAKRRPIGYMFDVAQAFVYQELRDRWLPQFRSSVSHTAMVDQMRMSYPVSLTQLLAEGPFNHCLNSFIYNSGECPTDLRVNFQVWSTIHSTLRPLCASALKKLDQRGITWASKDLSSLEEEAIQFRETYIEGPNVMSSILDEDVRFLIGKRIMGLTRCKPGGRDGILGIATGTGKSGTSHMETLKATVSALSDALLLGQEQAYRPLDERVVPTLTRSTTFGNFVDDLSALECAPLQARLRLLNDWADVQRKLPEKAVESTAGGRTSHLLRPCPTPTAPDVWPIASSKAGGVFTDDGTEGSGVRGRVLRAGGGADVTCPSLLFVFQVDTEDTSDLLDTEDSVALGGGRGEVGGGGGGGGVFGHAPRGLHGCAAVIPSRRTTGDASTRRVGISGKKSPGARAMRRRDTARSPSQIGFGNPGTGAGSIGVFSSSFPAPKSRMLRRFRTKVRQMRHVVAARVLQDTPPRRTGGGTPSVPEGEVFPAPRELDLLAGMASDDTDYRKVRSRLNGQILELIAADVTEWLPRYCLPSAIARVQTSTIRDRDYKGTAGDDGDETKKTGNPPEASPSRDENNAEGEEVEVDPAQPRVHHFVMTVPRKRSSPPGSPAGMGPSPGSPSRGNMPRLSRGNFGDGPGDRPGLSRHTSSRRWGTRPVKGSFPLAIDRESNLVLHAACATVWRKLEKRPSREDRKDKDSNEDEHKLQQREKGAGSRSRKARRRGGGQEEEEVETTAYVPRCVCALSFDPLFDTLRAVALARGGFPEAGRALMLGGGGTSGSPSTVAGLGSYGGGGSFQGIDAGAMEWGLGDAATLQAAPPPLPILPPPTPPAAPTLPTVFAPATMAFPLTGRGTAHPPSRVPPLVQSVSAPESLGGWSVESEEDCGVGNSFMAEATAGAAAGGLASQAGGAEPGRERWSSFGLPPLVPLDHPVEPLFQALSSDNVLLSLSALLCERPVVVTCSVRSLLSLAVSSLKTLLHPLGWHHAYAPLLPATEIVRFWRSKVLLDKKTALSQGRSGSPPRITPKQWGSSPVAGGVGSSAGDSVPQPRLRPQTAFLVGLEGGLVRMARGKPRGVFATGARDSKTSGEGVCGAEVWGVVSSESCMVSPGGETDAMGVATTQPSHALLETVRLMLRQSVHVDLDYDEVTWPPPPASSASPEDPDGRPGLDDVSTASRRSTGRADSLLGFGEDLRGGNSGEGTPMGRADSDGAPPAWPEEAARRAKRVIQSTLFPEFEDFDVVSPSPPKTAGVEAEDDSALFKCSRSAGGGSEVSLRNKIQACRNPSTLDRGKGRSGLGNVLGGVVGGRGVVSKMTESVVGMYAPTPADLALRAAAAGLVASVLGRVKEFTTLFAQAGLLRFDTTGFVAAVASENRSAAARGTRSGGNSPSVPPSAGAGGGSVASAVASSPYGIAGGSTATQDEDASPVVVESTADDGESAEGTGGDGRVPLGVPGIEMCLEVVRTRAFAALLADEVFADVDLEALQAELRIHSAQIRDVLPEKLYL